MFMVKVIDSLTELWEKTEASSRMSPVEFYNYWAQTTGIIVSNPDTAHWILDFIVNLLSSDKEFTKDFIS